MGDVLRDRVLAADGARVDAVALSGLAHGVVAAVEVLAILEMLGEVVAAVGEFAIQPEEPLLVGGEGLRGRAVLVAGLGRCEGRQIDAISQLLDRLRYSYDHEAKWATHLDVDLLCLVRIHGCSVPKDCTRLNARFARQSNPRVVY